MQTGLIDGAMFGSVADGYATVSTEGGKVSNGFEVASWAQTSPGNVNWILLQDFADTTLNDAAVIGKAITKDFYGRPPKKSYFNGCSMGGRQGLQMAQRHPDAYDGILAAAPAINFAKFIISALWPQLVMTEAGEYPPQCEFRAITSAAIKACDALDGVKDGIVSSPELCTFSAESLIGTDITCPDTNSTTTISALAVKVAKTAWAGAFSPDNAFLWHGLAHEAALMHQTNITCTENRCILSAFPLPDGWIRYFVLKDSNIDTAALTHEELVRVFTLSHQQYQSIISADDPDLRAFNRLGGKMITWHGLADPLIPPNGTRAYYEAVNELDDNVRDYYRYFEAPGVGHCWGGLGGFPDTAFEELVKWVETGEAPEFLPGRGQPDEENRTVERNLCPYPQRAVYKGSGDVRKADNFECL